MPFAPVIPLSGLGGWKFLERTQERQQELFDKSPDIQRQLDYFKENIGNVTSAADLVADRRLLTVALGAFGLSGEENKQAFVRNILDQGTDERAAFANRLGNPKYIAFTKAFSFGNVGGFTPTSSFANKISEKFLEVKFEEAVGDVDPTMRLAMNFKREMGELANQNLTENTGWFRAMGSEPLRTVLQSVFNLPTSFAQINIEQQKEVLIDKAKQMFGGSSINVFSDPEKMDKAIRTFQLREQMNNGPDPSTPGYAALSILSGGLGSGGILNLFLSNS